MRIITFFNWRITLFIYKIDIKNKLKNVLIYTVSALRWMAKNIDTVYIDPCMTVYAYDLLKKRKKCRWRPWEVHPIDRARKIGFRIIT